jgi:hypothetical protein
MLVAHQRQRPRIYQRIPAVAKPFRTFESGTANEQQVHRTSRPLFLLSVVPAKPFPDSSIIYLEPAAGWDDVGFLTVPGSPEVLAGSLLSWMAPRQHGLVPFAIWCFVDSEPDPMRLVITARISEPSHYRIRAIVARSSYF